MKIGLVTSWNWNFALFKFLNKFEHDYHIYYDQNNWPYGDKDFEYSSMCVKKWIDYLLSKWVEKIILPPVYEMFFLQDKKYVDKILLLFKNYLLNFVFQNSLVWKIWFFGDFADIQMAQNFISKIWKEYKLSENQKNIKKFNFPFKFWWKEVQMRKYFYNKLSFSNFMLNKIIKFDLRYFKDANVDSLIPLNYGYFFYQKTISNFFNIKKQKFHKLDSLEKIFCDLDLKNTTKYSVNIYYNGKIDLVYREKKILRLLQRGKSIEIYYKKLD